MSDTQTLGDYTPEQVMELLADNRRYRERIEGLRQKVELLEHQVEQAKAVYWMPPPGSVVVFAAPNGGEVIAYHESGDCWFLAVDREYGESWRTLLSLHGVPRTVLRWGES